MMMNPQLAAGAYASLGESIQLAADQESAALMSVGKMMQDVSNENIKFLTQQNNVAQGTLQPFITAGQHGMDSLNNILGVNGTQAQQTAYQNQYNAAVNPLNAQNQQFQNGVNNAVNQYGQQINSAITGFNKNLQDPNQLFDNTLNSIVNSPATQNAINSSLKYGIQSAQNSAAATGMLNSGRTMAQLEQLGQDTSNQQYMSLLQSALPAVMGAYGTNVGAQTSALQGQLQGAGAALNANIQGQAVPYAANASAYQQNVGQTQQSLLNLVGQGASTAGQAAQTAVNFGNDVSGQKTQGAAALGNAQIQASQVEGQGLISQSNLLLQAAMSGIPYGGVSGGPTNAAVGGSGGLGQGIGSILGGIALGSLAMI